MSKLNSFKNTLKSIFIIFAACIGIGFLIYFYASKMLLKTTADSLTEMAKLGAKIVASDIQRRLQFLETISKTITIKNPNLSLKEKAEYLNENFISTNFLRLSIADIQGNLWASDGNTVNIRDRDYFQKAVVGKNVVSNLLTSKIDGQTVLIFAVPIYTGGRLNGILSGVYKGEELSKITDKFRLGKEGNSFIIDRSGNIIAHDDRSLVRRQYNPIREARRDPSLKKLAGLIERTLQEKTGAGSYHYLGVNKYMGFAPIEGTDWSLAVAAPQSQIFKKIDQLLTFLVGSLLLICIIIILLNLHTEYLRKRVLKERKISDNVIEVANIILIKYDHRGNILEFNKFAEIKTGFAKEEVIGKMKISDFIVIDPQAVGILDLLITDDYPRKTEFAITTKANRILYFIGHCNSLNLGSSGRREYELMGIDITEMIETEKQLRESHEQLAALNEKITASQEDLQANYEALFESQKQLKESEERYSLLVDAAGIGIWDWDAQTKRLFLSTECNEILKINPQSDQEFFQEARMRIHPDDFGGYYRVWEAYQENRTGHFEYEHRIVLPNGEIRWLNSLIKAVWGENGKLIRMAGSFLDVTKLKDYQERLEHLAYHDSLTGLPNRLMLQSYWAEILSDRKALKTAIIFIDIDNFKLINDSLGHNFGDKLIVAIGSRLKTILGDSSIVFRIAGDEFVICTPGFNSNKEVEAVAKRLMQPFSEPFELENKRVHITVSMGIAIYPDHATDAIGMLKNADIAMYKAKELGKNRYVFYDPHMQKTIDERMQLEKNLRNALSQNEFHLYYQPQFDVRTGAVSGFEALLRWSSPELGMVSPLKFIGITEESGMIIELGEWVLEEACRFHKKLRQMTGSQFSIAVNVSIIQLMQDNFLRRVLRILEKNQIDPEFVELEITESVLIETFDTIFKKLKSLRDYRIRIALDDFGKGYSSLNYLCQLPISTLKIDKSFIDNIINADNDRIITGDIVAIGHKEGLEVIAEGVETQEQMVYLMNHDCDKIQGYFYCKPLPEEEVIRFLKTRK